MDNFKPKLTCITVYWNKPTQNYIELNTDVSSMLEGKLAGEEGVLRGHQGKIVTDFSEALYFSSSNAAKGYCS